jgi:tetratricopeptide (TPR) repeat protein
MKYFALFLSALIFTACDNSAPKPVANSNAVNTSQNSARPETVIAHSTENKSAPMGNSNTKTKWTQSGDPIDTKSLDAAIADADKALKAKPNDSELKSALAEAYFSRAMALTEARQYASALGDYRRVLKYDPDNEQAKDWVKQIIGIYNDMGRESPPEGQEPPPLRLNK